MDVWRVPHLQPNRTDNHVPIFYACFFFLSRLSQVSVKYPELQYTAPSPPTLTSFYKTFTLSGTRDPNITRSLQRRVSTKSSTTQIKCASVCFCNKRRSRVSHTKKFQGCEVNRVHGVAAVGQERQLRRDKYPGSHSETNSATAEGGK